MRQSYKHPTLVTVTVDGFGDQKGITPATVKYPEHHWRLPNTDPRNEGKYLFRLHTLDIYFWTSEDANSFIEIVEKLLERRQLEILDVPAVPAAQEQLMSPVVQKLETVAIHDPAYHNGQTRSSSSVAQSFSPPPVANDNGTAQNTLKPVDTTSFQPLAYNPAAPPEPEVIKHREKTPPPPESEAGTGLAAASYRDSANTAQQPPPLLQGSLHHPPYGQSTIGQNTNNPQQGQPTIPYASPPLSSGYGASSSSPHNHRSSNVSPFPPAPPLVGKTVSSPQTNISTYAPPSNPESSLVPYSNQVNTSFSPPPKDPGAQLYGKDPRRPDSPTAEILGDSYVGGPQQPLQHLQPQYADYLETRRQSQLPEASYSNYQYQQQQTSHHHHRHHPPETEYDVHNQVYRPTESEAHQHKHRKPSDNIGQQSGKLEQKAEKVEKGINRFLKKVEKKIG